MYAILFDFIAILYGMLMASRRYFSLAIGAIPVDALHRVVPSSTAPGLLQVMTIVRPKYIQWIVRALRIYRWRWGEWVAVSRGVSCPICASNTYRGGKEFSNLDLDIAEIALSCSSFPLPLVWIVRFCSPRWSTLEPAVPIVGDERFALISLC